MTPEQAFQRAAQHVISVRRAEADGRVGALAEKYRDIAGAELRLALRKKEKRACGKRR